METVASAAILGYPLARTWPRLATEYILFLSGTPLPPSSRVGARGALFDPGVPPFHDTIIVSPRAIIAHLPLCVGSARFYCVTGPPPQVIS